MKKNGWDIPYEKQDVSDELLDPYQQFPLLAQVLNLHPEIQSAQDAERLFFREVGPWYSGFKMKDMAKAVGRIRQAIEKKETVAVYGDYDVDGITATCIVTDYLRSRGIKCIPYIPTRDDEGYGLNCGAMEKLHKEENVSLVITVDCGITAVEEALFARAAGIDLIITDHHECGLNGIPDALAVIDCKQTGNQYNNPDLAGVGIALKLVCCCDDDWWPVFNRYVDLAAVGTIADVMPLTGENRFIVRRGLNSLKDSPRVGFQAIMSRSPERNSEHAPRIRDEYDFSKINASVIGYNLAPKLNAAGRMKNATIAAHMLLAATREEADRYAAELVQLNQERQAEEEKIWIESSALVKAEMLTDHAPLILHSDTWHPGVIGIAASRLADHYSVPTIMIHFDGDRGKGSCRSFGGFNLFEALSECREHLLSFGGHALAAGLNIRRDKLEDFSSALREYYLSHKPTVFSGVKCDLLITSPSLLSIENVRSLDLLEPYGNANQKPIMCITRVLLRDEKTVGSKKKHLKMSVNFCGQDFDCIFYNHTAQTLGIRKGDFLDLAFTPQLNDYFSSASPQIQLQLCAVRKHVPHELCSLILNGNRNVFHAVPLQCIPSAELHSSDFKKVWKVINQESFRLPGSADAILRIVPRGMSAEMFCVCLMVFLNAGLLQSENGTIFGAYVPKEYHSIDLKSSPIMQELYKNKV